MTESNEINFVKKVDGNDGREYSTATRLLDKHYSPMIVRRYNLEGWPAFISLICDRDLSSLDDIVHQSIAEAKESGMLKDSIQSLRNTVGYISDKIIEYYENQMKGCMEGCAVIWYTDKMLISSLWGDMMVHKNCKDELFQSINIMVKI